MILARNLHLDWGAVPGWFLAVRHDWYRPVPELVAAVAWQAFGLQPLAYRLLALALYVVVMLLVGVTAERLADDRRTGLVAAGLFAAFHFHAEPAAWFAAGNELLAGAFAVSTLLAFVGFLRTGRPVLLACALGTYLLALGSKESTFGLPLVLVACRLLAASPHESRKSSTDPASPHLAARVRRRLAVWRRLAPWPFVLVGAAFLVLRLAVGNPYGVPITPATLIRNAGHYATLELLAWPIDFDYTTFDAAHGLADLLPAFTVCLATISLVALAAAWAVSRPGRPGNVSPPAAISRPDARRAVARALERLTGSTGAARILVVGTVWALVTIVPVLPIVAERTAFLSSIGVAWVLAAVVADIPSRALNAPWARRVAAVALVGLVLANGTALAWRATWWAAAGRTSRAVLTELDAQVARLPADAEVWVVGLPDHLRHAYVFRNAFPSVGAVRGYRQTVHAVLDDELPPGTRAAQLAEIRARPRAVVLSYAGGRIVRGSDPAR